MVNIAYICLFDLKMLLVFLCWISGDYMNCRNTSFLYSSGKYMFSKVAHVFDLRVILSWYMYWMVLTFGRLPHFSSLPLARVGLYFPFLPLFL